MHRDRPTRAHCTPHGWAQEWRQHNFASVANLPVLIQIHQARHTALVRPARVVVVPWKAPAVAFVMLEGPRTQEVRQAPPTIAMAIPADRTERAPTCNFNVLPDGPGVNSRPGEAALSASTNPSL